MSAPFGRDPSMLSFFELVWPHEKEGELSGVGIIDIPYTWTDAHGNVHSGFKHHYATTLDDAVEIATRLDAEGHNVYLAMSMFCEIRKKKGKGDKGSRCGDNALKVKSLWFDIDCGPGKPYADQIEGFKAFMNFCKAVGLPRPTIVVKSGNGLHIYLVFDRPIAPAKWLEVARKLKRLCEALGFKADKSRTSDIASVLRVPGTRNFKDPTNPKPVEIAGEFGALFDPLAIETVLDAALLAVPAAQAGALGGPAPAHAGDDIEGNIPRDKLPPPSPERLKSAVLSLPDNLSYDEWRDMIWAGMASGLPDAEDVLREWSMRSPWWDQQDGKGLTGEQRFAPIVANFDPNRDNPKGVGSLFRLAKAHGWVEPMKFILTGNGNTPAQVSIVSARADRGDVQNAELFARLNLGRLLHIAETGDWLKFYLEAGWLTAANGEADRAAKAALAELAHFAGTQWAERPDDARSKKLIAHVEKSHALPRLRAMIELSKSEPGMTERLSNFDADPWLLGVNNGVLNLKTGALTPMSPNVLVSKRSNAAFDPDADCPLWEEFLRHVQPDPEMQPFLRRLCGYFLSGVVAEHIFPFLSGGGGNGKGVFVETIAYVIGEYAVKIETAMLMEHKRSPQSASPDIMKLRGARLAFCSETSEGQRLDAERVKEMTGGDTLTARPLYGNPVSFQPSHKLMMMGNYKPEVSDMSAGMWRRVLLIPFAVDIPKGQQDTRLPDKLKHEASGILNWMLFGLRDWRNAGLQVPESVSSATNAYRDENDIVGEWIREECKAQVGRREAKDELYNSYCQWCESNGHMPTAKNRLTRKLTPRGFVLDAGRRNVIGLRLKTPAEKAAEKTAEKAEVDEAEEFAKTSLEEPAAHMASALDPPQGLGPS